MFQVTIQATGKISWRREGIKYRYNKGLLDVVESVNLLVSNKGTVLRQDVSGVTTLDCQLSGMPECKLGMNDKIAVLSAESGNPGAAKKSASTIELDDITFHQCVRLHSFDADRSISFVPPDGVFELMRYRITENIQRPFLVMATVTEVGRTRVEFKVQLKSNFSAQIVGWGVVCKIPCPPSTATTQMLVTAGKATYVPEENVIAWKIKRFPGESMYNFSGEAALSTTTSDKAWSRPPITMEFAVPFAASGLEVKYFKVIEKSIADPFRGVRYLTKAGAYEHRI